MQPGRPTRANIHTIHDPPVRRPAPNRRPALQQPHGPPNRRVVPQRPPARQMQPQRAILASAALSRRPVAPPQSTGQPEMGDSDTLLSIAHDLYCYGANSNHPAMQFVLSLYLLTTGKDTADVRQYIQKTEKIALPLLVNLYSLRVQNMWLRYYVKGDFAGGR